MLLTDSERIEIVKQFVRGEVTTNRLIDAHYQKLADAGELPDKSELEIRRCLANEIRTANPYASQFAKTKFGDVYDAERELVREHRNEFHQFTARVYVLALESELKLLKPLVDATRELMKTALDEGNSKDVAAAIKAYCQILNELRLVFTQILNATRPSPNPDDV